MAKAIAAITGVLVVLACTIPLMLMLAVAAIGGSVLNIFGSIIDFFTDSATTTVIVGNTASARVRGVPQSCSWRPHKNGPNFNTEYKSISQATEWCPRSCGAASVTAILRAYNIKKDGRTIYIKDVLEVAIPMGAIASPGGWQGPDYFIKVLKKFDPSFTGKVVYDNGDLDDAIAKANAGYPVITHVKGREFFKGGHIIVIAGGNKKVVKVADSSGSLGGSQVEIKEVPRSQFEALFNADGARYTVAYPKGYNPQQEANDPDDGIPIYPSTKIEQPNIFSSIQIPPIIIKPKEDEYLAA